MPPKVKFSKETMIGTALQLVREKGMASLTAGALEKLGATPRVIFGQFANMSELQAEVIILCGDGRGGVYTQVLRR